MCRTAPISTPARSANRALPGEAHRPARSDLANRMPSEIAEMVDWSEAGVETIARRYVGAAAIANTILARMRRRT